MVSCGVVFRIFLLTGLLSLGICSGQNTPPDSPPEMVGRNLAALNGVAEPMKAATDEIARLNGELAIAATDSRKADLAARIQAERERITQLRANFLDIVGGSESTEYDQVKQAQRSLQDQISDLLDPLVGALREPTEKLRHTEQMRKDLAKWQDSHEKAGRVLERIDELLVEAKDERVKDELSRAKRLWESRRSDATGNIEVLRLQVEEREKTTPTVWESISGMFRDFWATRGLNLLLALIAAAAAWFAVQKGHDMLRRASPTLRKKGTFMSKAASMLAVGFAGFASLMAVILVFFIRGDWLLLTLVIVMLLGAAWAGKTTLPSYIEQIKMLLNLGSVREGERVLYRDLPWEVTSLGFYSFFTNPALEGGVIRIPLKDVMSMISRLTDGKEQWFPTRREDWIVLADDTYGKVIHQSPEQVVLIKLGGMTITYPTAEFLKQIPRNLMTGFRVSSKFGISYDCQKIAASDVAHVFQTRLSEELHRELGKDAVRSVKVEFATAASSSLDYVILADFTGEVAQRLKFIERMIQKICVEVCNEQGWEIPFTQITIHQAVPTAGNS